MARKVMGDVAIAHVEGAGGTRVSEDEVVSVGKNDVCSYRHVNASTDHALFTNSQCAFADTFI